VSSPASQLVVEQPALCAIFEHDTDSASARDAFLTAVVITGGAGPAITLLLFWVGRLITRKNNFEVWQNILDGPAMNEHFVNRHNVGWS
jgi:hypothetical protein